MRNNVKYPTFGGGFGPYVIAESEVNIGEYSQKRIRVTERIFGPRATAVILKILCPFKYPGLGVISSE